MGTSEVLPQGVKQLPPAQKDTSLTVLTFKGKDLPPQYTGLIYSKWLRSLRHQNDYFRLIDPKVYYSKYSEYISSLLSKEETWVNLAVLTEDHDVVFGFSVTRGKVLDYVHVLRMRLKTDTGVEIIDYRRKGIGTRLIPSSTDTFTHITKTGLIIWAEKYPNWKFNPFA